MMWLLVIALWLAASLVVGFLIAWSTGQANTDDETTIDRWQARREAAARAQRRAVRR